MSYAEQKQNRRSQCAIEREQSAAIRTMSDEQGNPLFCGKDVAEALGYKRVSDAISGRVEKEDTVKCRTLTNGGAQLMLYINESGLYSLILSSKLLNKNTFTEKVVSFPILRKRCDCGLGYSNGRDVVRKHVEVEDKTTVAICDTGYVDDEYGMKRPTPTMMG